MSSTKVNSRVDFGKIKHLAETPDLLEVQIQSFKEFFQLETTPDKRNIEGLFRVFKDNFPITDTRNQFVSQVWRILNQLTEPVLAPIRRALPKMQGLDLSPLVLFLIIFFIQQVIGRYGYQLMPF